jgi:hypothetical protein
MRQLPERLFLVFLLLLSLPVFNPGNGIFAGNSFEWQEDRKNSRQSCLLIPEIEEECESEEDEKERFNSGCLRTCFSNFEFLHSFSRYSTFSIREIPYNFLPTGGKRKLQLLCVWRI